MIELIHGYQDVHTILDELAIDHWLEAGTLLWIYRNGIIKPGDKDVDLGAYYEHVTEAIHKIKEKSIENGFDLQVNDSKITFTRPSARITVHLFKTRYLASIPHHRYKTCVFYDKHRKLADIINYLFLDGLTSFESDVIYRKNIRKKIVNIIKNIEISLPGKVSLPLYYALVRFGVKTRILKFYYLTYPTRFHDDLKTIDFYNTKVCIPLATEEYLTYCYGNWKVRPDNYPRDGYYQTVAKNSGGFCDENTV